MLFFAAAALCLLATAVSSEEYSDSSEPTICYGDDECRGKQICDMGSYTCVDPTPSPIWTTPAPTEPAGCCYNGDSYKGNDKCLQATTQSKCEDKGCSWRVTDDPTDCELTTTETPPTPQPTSAPGCCRGSDYKSNGKCGSVTEQGKCERSTNCEWLVTDDVEDCAMTTTESPTTTAEVGCCKGDSFKSNSKCNAITDGDKCDARSSCHFVIDGVLEDGDCDFDTTEAPEDPGCCYGNPDAAYSKRWMETCTTYFTERECLMLTDDDGNYRCHWEDLIEGYDCSLLWPTTTSTPTEPAGCCHGDSYKANAKCVNAMDRGKCEKNGCSWLLTDDPSDCEMTTESPTPKPTAAPGCCYGDSYKANGKCVKAIDQGKCEQNGCQWLVTDDAADCEMTTTETPTTTAQKGCCKGDSVKSNEKCNSIEDGEKCDARSSCHFVIDGVLEDGDCDFGTTEAPEDPGCCYGNPDAAYSKRWMDTCTTYFTERECLMLTDDDGAARCAWEPMGEYEDCEQVWPTTTSTPTEPAGCCHGDSYKANDKCVKAMDKGKCEKNGCSWLVTDDPEDCEMTTTPSPTAEPGCCYGDSYKANAKCAKAASQMKCEQNGCNWLVTDDETDCEITTTSSPTTTEEMGCCKGDSVKSNDKCNGKLDSASCERMSSCEWIIDGVLEDGDCDFGTTEAPEDPGCCYGNPDAAYSKRWMEACIAFYTERDCLMLTDSEGGYRCAWEPMGEYEDCSQIWPTTTTEAPGCCHGLEEYNNYRNNERCLKLNTKGEQKCLDDGFCAWLVTDDPSDCEMTTTAEPAGCCHGDGYEANNKCGKATSQSKCENNGCSWLVTEDPSDCELTTTSEPWMGEKAEHQLPFNPYKASRKNSALSSAMAKKGRHQEEAMLFGASSSTGTITQAMDYQVSLSSVLLLVIAAVAVLQIYRWFAARSNSSDNKLVGSHTQSEVYYQTA